MFQFYTQTALPTRIARGHIASRAARRADLDPRTRLDRLHYFSQKTPERFLEWCTLYMPHAFPTEWGRHHRQIAQALCIKGQTVEVLEPREHGKTTEVDAHDIYCICNGFDQYIIRFEHDAGIAKKKGNLFAGQLLNNDAILADYRPAPGLIWRPNNGELEVCIENPYATHHQVYFRSIGVLNISRGTTYNFSRIDRAVLNDVVANSKEANSAGWNNFLENLILRDIAFAGGGGNQGAPISIYMVTTIQAKNDISDRLRQNPTVIVLQTPAILGETPDVLALADYVSHDTPNIRAMIDGILGTPETGFSGEQLTTEHFETYCQQPAYQQLFARLASMWEAQFSMAKHVWDMFRSGTAAWLQERQHITADGQFQKFFATWFTPYTALPAGVFDFGIAIDSAGEPRDGTDPVVVLSGAMSPSVQGELPDLYLLDVWCEQGTPTQIVYKAFQFANRLRADFGVSRQMLTVFLEAQVGDEGSGTQALFYEIQQKELALGDAESYADGTPRPEAYRDPAYWETLYVPTVPQRTNKIVRLLDFRVVAEQGRIHINPHDQAHQLAVTQFVNFKGEQTHKNLPLEQKIDIPDMIELLYRKLNLPPINKPIFSNS